MTDKIRPHARERILEAAYDLFSRRGVRDVTVDEIIERSGVAIATFYRHFRSKNDLAAAFLNRREQVWSIESIVDVARSRSTESTGQLLAIFDVFDEWFHREDFEGDSFVNVMIEMGPEHPLGKASIVHLENVRKSVQQIADEGGLEDVVPFARSYQVLMKGSIIAATMGDLDSARRAKQMAEWLIAEHEGRERA